MEKLLVSGLLVGAILLSVPIFTCANKNLNFWGGNQMYGGMGQGMRDHPVMGMMHGNMINSGGVM